MTPEQIVAVVAAFATLLSALAAVMVQIRKLHDAVNGRLTQLLEERETAARRLGEMEGRDFMRRLLTAPRDEE